MKRTMWIVRTIGTPGVHLYSVWETKREAEDEAQFLRGMNTKATVHQFRAVEKEGIADGK